MPDLTIISCPTCGLPAELLTSFDPDPATGVLRELLVRCMDDHVATIQLSGSGAAPSGAPAEIDLTEPPPEPSPADAPVGVVPIRNRHSLLARVVDALRTRSRIIFWFAFGALAAALFRQSPLAALVLLPLSLPVAGLVSARRSWAPVRLAPPAPGVALVVPPAEEGQEAA
ncbi:MAG TPA: hypothetical protein VFW71_07070 [Actinomycetota bacterium]|nr:hypothetical protein [Actinomycetota bacterium]